MTTTLVKPCSCHNSENNVPLMCEMQDIHSFDRNNQCGHHLLNDLEHRTEKEKAHDFYYVSAETMENSEVKRIKRKGA